MSAQELATILIVQTVVELLSPYDQPQGKVMLSEASVSHSVHRGGGQGDDG